jgi:hypothetical protein
MVDDLIRHVSKFYGKYSGDVVKNDNDADRSGKIVVKVPAVFGQSAEVTARPCFPFGQFFVPSVGSKVWIEFEGGHTDFPIWVGIWYPPGKTPKQAAISPPDNRVIETPSGHTIEIMDKAGEEKITIKHKGNSFISIDKNGSVLLSNQKGSFVFLNSDRGEATLMEQHGHLLTMTSKGVLISNKDSTLLELTGDTARLSARNIILQGTSVAVGAGATNPPPEPAILGQTFMQMWNTFIASYAAHTHGTALGPSSPPLPPLVPPPVLAPGKGLASAVVVK